MHCWVRNLSFVRARRERDPRRPSLQKSTELFYDGSPKTTESLALRLDQVAVRPFVTKDDVEKILSYYSGNAAGEVEVPFIPG